jgi:hypothetical protein
MRPNKVPPVFRTHSDGSIDQLVEVLKVRENNMSAHVEKESLGSNIGACKTMMKQSRQSTKNDVQNKSLPSSLVESINHKPTGMTVHLKSSGSPKSSWP